MQQRRFLANCRHFLRLLKGRIRGNDVEGHCWVARQCGEGHVVKASQLACLCLVALVPVKLDNAILADECVFERAVQDEEALIVFLEDVVDVFRGLLGHRNILWAVRHKFHDPIARREDTHQGWHDRLHRVTHVHADNLAASVFLIAKWLTAIVFCRLRADRGDGVVNKINRVINLSPNDALQLVIIHVIWIDKLVDLVGQVVDFVFHVSLLASE